MRNVNRQSTAPVKFPRSKRFHNATAVTSVKPGVCAPLAVIPLFRGDGITGRKHGGKWSSSRISYAIEMAETKDMIMNPVRARVTAYCVPWLANERFGGSRDEFDKSYAGQQGLAGQVIPFVETHEWPAYGTSAFYDALGMHGAPGDDVSTMYLEAYNAVWNFRARNRSKEITERGRLEQTLAPAFWPAGRFEYLVPDFDDAVMDGQVALNVVSEALPVRRSGGTVLPVGGTPIFTGAGAANRTLQMGADNQMVYAGASLSLPTNVLSTSGLASDLTNVYAEMVQNGITVSLANIEMAKKAQAFAKLRAKYEGHEDDYIIDTYLMNGLRLPDQAMKQPFLIADQTVTFRQAKRYATDSGNLDQSAVSGIATGEITLRVPALDVGGIVIVQVEILPDQLFERQRDPFLHSKDVSEWPEAMRDYADPEKVDVVLNGDIDTDHSDPDGLFGYGPKNWQWTSWGPRIGGKFIKPEAEGGANVLRQRFWAHEEKDPALAESFYLCQGLTTSIFLDGESDPFEIALQGGVIIDGLTQFGGQLIEATDNYDRVMDQMDQTRVKEENA